jgi:hypothetical protein
MTKLPHPRCLATLAVFLLMHLALSGCKSSAARPPASTRPSAQSHPFLIVRAADFPALRDRAATAPWSQMKADALKTARAGYGTISANSWWQVRWVIDAAALAYILDPAHKTAYKSRVVEGITQKLDLLAIRDPGGEVWTGSALVGAIVALDVVYPDLTTQERADCESKIQSKVDLIRGDPHNPHLSHPWCRAVLHATWDTYLQNGSRVHSDWLYNTLDQFTSADGVYLDSCGYCMQEVGTDYARSGNAAAIDVMELSGKDPRYYRNPKFRNLHEWMYGYVMNPDRKVVIFGDTNTLNVSLQSQYAGQEPILRAGRFSDTAAEYAAWANNGASVRGNLLSYCIPERALPAAVKPKSRIFPDGGAWFWENNPSNLSLMGALWNVKEEPTETSGHLHKETNAIYLAGYGEHLLLNAGYSGWNRGVDRFDWNWIHNTDESGNTLSTTLHGQVVKHGNGIVEGFAGGLLDYACGDAGPALPDNTHRRNFVMVHPQDGANGYWLLFDEVGAAASEQVRTFLHPNTLAAKGLTPITAKQEYLCPIDALTYHGTSVGLDIFYGTPPAAVSMLDGGFGCSWIGKGYVTQYLAAQYAPSPTGQTHIVTVLFPYDPAHPRAAMSRLAGPGMTGACMNHGRQIVDYALESDGAGNRTHAGVTFRGTATVYRKIGRAVKFYFVRKGTMFDDGGATRRGFEVLAGKPLSVYLRDRTGTLIASAPGRMTFYYPSITGVKLNGAPVSNHASGREWVSVDIPSGTSTVQLLAPPAP